MGEIYQNRKTKEITMKHSVAIQWFAAGADIGVFDVKTGRHIMDWRTH